MSVARPDRASESVPKSIVAGRLKWLWDTLPKSRGRRTGRGLLRLCGKLAEHLRLATQLLPLATSAADREAIQVLLTELTRRRDELADNGRLARAAWLEREYGFSHADAVWLLKSGFLDRLPERETSDSARSTEQALDTRLLLEHAAALASALTALAVKRLDLILASEVSYDAEVWNPTAFEAAGQESLAPREAFLRRLAWASRAARCLRVSLESAWNEAYRAIESKAVRASGIAGTNPGVGTTSFEIES